MKRFLLLLTFFYFCANFLSFAADAEAPSYSFNFQNVSPDQVLKVYKNLSGLELIFNSSAKSINASIDLQTAHPVTKDEGIKLFEKALKEQAGLVIARIDDKTARVTYDPAVRVNQPKQKMPRSSEKIILTAKDVDPKSVRVITGPTSPTQNLIFRYVKKTPDEIKVIGAKHPDVQIMKGGVVVVETDGGSGLHGDNHTNLVGLVLMFKDYDKAKLAERTLRGN